ncbi:1966_t:CDS:2 [Acaulospora colombiana]|uniref:1966_t:CDS:1 n=1 Tax=Acaulospora colombiana TaxID=27376 RepID=A0ACA9KI86_9GLOM|nr:1966_t:CDS:2 [Acaulospora colombiana]
MVAIKGANGITAAGMGIVASTPRNGALPVPFEQDTSVIRDREISSGRTGVCGRTAAGGNNDVAAEVESASSSGLPSMSEDDGGGPYACEISSDASGSDFQPMTVTTNVPGVLGFSAAAAKDFPLVARKSLRLTTTITVQPLILSTEAPAGTTCTGGPNGDACLVRCRNNTPAGPFGSCATVTNPESGSVSTKAVQKTAASSGSGAGGGAGGVGGKLKGLLGGFLKRWNSGGEEKKRVVGSRIVDRSQAGKWI